MRIQIGHKDWYGFALMVLGVGGLFSSVYFQLGSDVFDVLAAAMIDTGFWTVICGVEEPASKRLLGMAQPQPERLSV